MLGQYPNDVIAAVYAVKGDSRWNCPPGWGSMRDAEQRDRSRFAEEIRERKALWGCTAIVAARSISAERELGILLYVIASKPLPYMTPCTDPAEYPHRMRRHISDTVASLTVLLEEDSPRARRRPPDTALPR